MAGVNMCPAYNTGHQWSIIKCYGTLAGSRGEVAVAELCRREGIHPTIYYKWLKDFMEAGKGRMRGDTKREATSEEVRQLREENERLKQLVAELSLANLTLKKSLF